MFIPGMCVNHPTIRVAEGQKFKCAQCAAPRATVEEIKAVVAKSEAQNRPGRKADPAVAARKAKEAADRAANKAKREADALANQRNNPEFFHNWMPGTDPETLLGQGKINYEQFCAELSIMDATPENLRPCGKCGVVKKLHGWVKEAASQFPDLDHSDQKPVFALVLARGRSKEECEAHAQNIARDFSRNGERDFDPIRMARIDHLPRAERIASQSYMARLADPVVGMASIELDSHPWALWMPVDVDNAGRIEKDHEGKAMFWDKVPSERSDPSRWNEARDMFGGEVIDLRRFPQVLRECKEKIEANLDNARENAQAFRRLQQMKMAGHAVKEIA